MAWRMSRRWTVALRGIDQLGLELVVASNAVDGNAKALRRFRDHQSSLLLELSKEALLDVEVAVLRDETEHLRIEDAQSRQRPATPPVARFMELEDAVYSPVVAGNDRCCKTLRNSCPTAPVTPTIATFNAISKSFI